ncbi:MAG: M23 family metallopeptidase [Actinomycetota bacterium]
MRRAFGMVLAVALAATASARADSAVLDRARQQVRSQEQGPLIDVLRSADERRQSIEDSMASLQSKINDIQRQLNALKPELDTANLQRENAAHAVATAQAAYDQSRKILAQSALELYSTGRLSYGLRLMGSNDLASFASAQVFMETVVDSGTKVVYGFEHARDQLRLEKQHVDQMTAAIEKQTQDLLAQQQELAIQQRSLQQASQDLNSAILARAQAIASIQNDPNGVDLILRSYGAGTAAIRLLVAAAQAGEPISNAGNTSLWWPAQGPITSPFGWRIHPILHVRSFHTGIDIGASYGAPIRAAQPGVVVDVIYLGAFGLVTVIDHGFSLATMYAHQSRSLVYPGERVQAGQIIGAIGCTGWCTGPHLHFEVWSRSNPVDPINWLS